MGVRRVFYARELSGEQSVRGQYNPGTMERTSNQQDGSADISQLLRAWSDGDQLALDKLTPIVYAELRR
jgi:hypothetical protein